MAQPRFKFTYFHGKGRGELTRLAFAAGGIAFDDDRIDHSLFEDLKHSLPLGQVPVLDVDGRAFPQSRAIARYAARLGGLYPTDPFECLKVDVALDTQVELTPLATEIIYRTPDPEQKPAKAKELSLTLNKLMDLIESYIVGPFLLGDKLSLGDLAVLDLVENMLKPAVGANYDTSKYGKIEALIAAVKANERVAAYLSN